MTKDKYSNESKLSSEFTEKNNLIYSRIAKGYDFIIKVLPFWKNWIIQAIPHIRGEKVLEVSFGTGLLLSQYADKFETCGIDYNAKMVELAKKNLESKGIAANLIEGNVESLPYENESFDTVINTMAFTGYPNSILAMSELKRVLKTDGRLILVDINYPINMNFPGRLLTKLWMSLGDVVRDMDKIFRHFDFEYTDTEIGGFGSVHLYIAIKQ